MNPADIRRTVLRVGNGEEAARVDILTGGRVRLRLVTHGGVQDLFCDTLEDVALLAAAEPALRGRLYEQLCWELDLRGLRGE